MGTCFHEELSGIFMQCIFKIQIAPPTITIVEATVVAIHARPTRKSRSLREDTSHCLLTTASVSRDLPETRLGISHAQVRCGMGWIYFHPLFYLFIYFSRRNKLYNPNFRNRIEFYYEIRSVVFYEMYSSAFLSKDVIYRMLLKCVIFVNIT